METTVKVAEWVHRIMTMDFPSEVREIALTAGFGAGKTRGLIQAHHFLSTAVNTQSDHSWFTEPTAQLVKMIALPEWREHLSGENGCGLTEGKHYEIYESSPYRVVLYRKDANPHTVWLPSCENEKKLVGASISHATIDEPGVISLEAKTKIFSRVRCPKATLKWIKLLGGTPEGLGNWYADQYNIPPELASGSRYRMQLATRDNVFHSDIEAYIASLIEAWAHAPDRLEAYISGEFVNLSSNNLFGPLTYADTSADWKRSKQVFLSFDFNAFPLAYIVGVMRENGTMHFLRSSSANARYTLRECVKELVTNEFDEMFDTVFEVYGDRSGHTTSHRSELDDYEIISSVFKAARLQCNINTPRDVVPQTGSTEEVNRLLARGMLTFDKTQAATLCSSMLKTEWQKNIRTIHKPAGDTWTHWSDALRYLIYWLSKNGTLDYKQRSLGVKQK